MSLYTTEQMVPQNSKEEKLARYLCSLDQVEPEATTTGLGITLPHGVSYKLWQIRVPKARAIIEWEQQNSAG